MRLHVLQRKMQQLEGMSYLGKVKFWAQEDPLPKKLRINNTTTFLDHRIKMDDAGNIIDMPPVIGKPCFGIPTAWLRHGRARAIYVPRLKENLHASRCDQCKIKKSCLKVIKKRLIIAFFESPEDLPLLKAWKLAGGLEDGGFSAAYGKLHQGMWTKLVRAIMKTSFTSTNDIVAMAAAAAKLRQSIDKAETEHRRALKRSWKNNGQMRELRNWLDDGRSVRQAILHELKATCSLPDYLNRLSDGFIERYGAAWWGREYCKFTGGKINPNSVATVVVEQTRIEAKSKDVFRMALRDDLVRIGKLEKDAKYNNGTAIWPKNTLPP